MPGAFQSPQVPRHWLSRESLNSLRETLQEQNENCQNWEGWALVWIWSPMLGLVSLPSMGDSSIFLLCGMEATYFQGIENVLLKTPSFLHPQEARRGKHDSFSLTDDGPLAWRKGFLSGPECKLGRLFWPLTACVVCGQELCSRLSGISQKEPACL